MDKPGKEINLELVRILELCRDIELHIAEIYKFFTGLFKDNPQISDLWKKTYNEELNHAHQFVLAINMRKECIIGSLDIDLYTAGNILNLVKSVYDNVRKNNPNLADALRSSIKMEEKLAKFHLQTLAHFTDESYKAMFTAMMNADNCHVEALKDFHKKILGCKN